MYLKKSNKFYFGINTFLINKSLIMFGFSKYWFFKNQYLIILKKYKKRFKLDRVLRRRFIVGLRLRDRNLLNVRKLIIINSYKGSRHRFKLPVHGQRTKCNARTHKNKRKHK